MNPAIQMALLKIGQGKRNSRSVQARCDGYGLVERPVLNGVQCIVMDEILDGILAWKPVADPVNGFVEVKVQGGLSLAVDRRLETHRLRCMILWGGQ